MKKMYEKTVMGCYAISMVLGVLLAVTLQLLYELICVETLFVRSAFAWAMFDLDLPWLFFGGFAGSEEAWWQHILPFRVVAVILVIISITMSMLLMKGKNWRTKAIHSVMVAFLVWLVAITVYLAYYEYTPIETLLMLAALTVIPLLVLKRTRVPKKGEGNEAQKETEAKLVPWIMKMWSWIGQFANENPGPTILAGMLTVYCVVNAIIAHDVVKSAGCIFMAAVYLFLTVKLYNKKTK